MRTKVTLILLFLNVALFFFIFQFERNWRTERASLEARSRVLGPEAADIRSLTLRNPAGVVYSLTRTGESWQITQPLDWPAKSTAVASIIHALQFLDHETSFAVADLAKNGQSLADYGLDQKKLIVEFSNGATATGTPGLTTKLILGDTTKIGNRLYLLSPDGQRIHVVSRALADSLAIPLEQLRADQLLTIPVFEARTLRLQSATRVALHRDTASGAWTFDTPIVARASKKDTELALSALHALHAKTFVAERPANLPSAAPSYRITIEGNNRRETLLLGALVPKSANEYYAQIEGRAAVFTVEIPTGPTSLQDTLDQAQERLRERHVLDFDAAAVTAITLKAPNAPGQPLLTLQRLEAPAGAATAAAWQIIRRDDAAADAPQTLPADHAAVQRLLEQLTLLSARVFASDAPTAADIENWGFARPEREITLTLSKPPVAGSTAPAPASTQLVLQLGLASQRDNYVYARIANIDGLTSVYAVDPDILRLETPTAPTAWRERLVRELPAGARITTLTLTDLTTNQTVSSVALDEKGQPPADLPKLKSVATVLAAVRTLRAKNFPQDGFTEKVPLLGEDRPWRYRLDATLALPGATAGTPAPVTSLFLTERFGGSQQLAGSPEAKAVFELEQPVVDALWALTYTADPGPVIPAAPAKP